MVKLNWAVAPFTGLVEFYSPWKKREDAHSTRLRNHKSKWYRFETARGWRRGKGRREREKERAYEGSVWGCCAGEQGCYERCVQLTVACSVRTVSLDTGVVNARGIPTYLRQFLFMANPPSPQGRWGRSFSLIGIELLFSFINDAGNPSSTIFYRCYHHRTECAWMEKVYRKPWVLYYLVDQIKQIFILHISK